VEPQIIFEDDFLLVLDKPAGMVVNRAISAKGKTLQDWLEENFQSANWRTIFNDQACRSGIVHRLDKETSGILLVAKTQDAFADLQDQFRKRKVQKKYLALVHGRVEPKEGTVEAPVGRLPWNRERFGVFPGGREARTAYKAETYYEKEGRSYTLLELNPQTGRTHQIRVHLKFLGYPIVSDNFYAGRKTARADRKWCPRLFLHASEISFIHPETERRISFSSPLPQELAQALQSFKGN